MCDQGLIMLLVGFEGINNDQLYPALDQDKGPTPVESPASASNIGFTDGGKSHEKMFLLMQGYNFTVSVY